MNSLLVDPPTKKKHHKTDSLPLFGNKSLIHTQSIYDRYEYARRTYSQYIHHYFFDLLDLFIPLVYFP
jgi:hypothetical protein